MIIRRWINSLTNETIQFRLQYLRSLECKANEGSPITVRYKEQTFSGLSHFTTPSSVLSGINLPDTLACIVQEDSVEHSSTQTSEILHDLNKPLTSNCTISFIDFQHPLGQQIFWHSSSHILGSALETYTKGLLANGPALSSGFYYDIETFNLSSTDLQALEDICNELIKKNLKFEKFSLNKTQALELFKYNPYKLHFIERKIPENGLVGVYQLGDFVDLCAGPHLQSTGIVKAFKLTETSAVHWLNNLKNSPLQRVYGVSFPSKSQLTTYISHQKALAERDHRKLGANLYFWHPFAAGSAFFLPDGTKIYFKLIEFIKNQYKFRGFTEVISPNLFNLSLWQQSGHLSKYKQDMFTLTSEDEDLGLKPMNCPGHCLIFSHSQHSYKDLPIRLAEFGVLHRNEFTGALSGLTRVRRFVQDDSHIFCTVEQISSEVQGCLDFLDYIYKIFGFEYKVELSTKPSNALGSEEIWETAENQLKSVLSTSGIPWKECKGEGAFYGPKIDFKIKDVMGREHQCGTIQLDFNLPKRFNLQYKAQSPGSVQERVKYEDMEEKEVRNGFARPVIIHRAILGSLERMIAILTEHYAGKWPFWLSPRQVCVVPVSEKYLNYAQGVKNRMINEGFYAEIDESNNSLNKKIRNAQLGKFNYIAVVGEKEVESGTVNLRERDLKDPIGILGVEQVVEMFKELKPEKSKAEKEFEQSVWKSN